MTVADFYDALRSHRPYRRSLSMSEVLGIMQKESGSTFNPGLLARFTLLMVKARAEGETPDAGPGDATSPRP